MLVLGLLKVLMKSNVVQSTFTQRCGACIVNTGHPKLPTAADPQTRCPKCPVSLKKTTKQSVYHLPSRNRLSRVNLRRRDGLRVSALIVLSTLVPGFRLAPPAMAKSQNRPLSPGEAMALIKDLGDTAVAMLSNKSLNHADKYASFATCLTKVSRSRALPALHWAATGERLIFPNVGATCNYLKITSSIPMQRGSVTMKVRYLSSWGKLSMTGAGP